MNKNGLINFLIKARTETYAGGKGKVKPILKGSKQLEYKEGNFFYRDIYYVGDRIFSGLEVVYFKQKPVFSISYFGNYKKATEKEIDDILRRALIENKDKTRLWHNVKWKYKNYKYICKSQNRKSIDEIGGEEKILKDKKIIYHFYYAGGVLI